MARGAEQSDGFSHFAKPLILTVPIGLSAPKPPDCLQVLSSTLTSFLTAHAPGLLAWDPSLVSDLVTSGETNNVDPRLMSSIAALESGRGNKFSANNPFGLGPGLTFTSPQGAVNFEGGTLNKYIYQWSEGSVSQLYSGNNAVYGGRWNETVIQRPGYCAAGNAGQAGVANCQAGGRAVSSFLLTQGAPGTALRAPNPANLGFPCPF